MEKRKISEKLKWQTWFLLVLILVALGAWRLKPEPTLYFGDTITNPFQDKGDFYDPVKGHTGIDLGTPVGTPISLPVPLRVVDILVQNEMGNVLYTKDAWGNILVFAHLSEILVDEGDIIKADQVFAKTGNSGKATTGPHLHFEIIAEEPQAGYEIMTRSLGNYRGYNIDPLSYWETLP